jgi:hypothetical protein
MFKGPLPESQGQKQALNVLYVPSWLDSGSVQPPAREFISHKVFILSFCKSQSFHKSFNLSFTIAHIKNNLTNFCGN